MRYPIDNGQYWISQGFIAGHLAIDLAANTGVPVKAPESGVVTAINRIPAAYFGGMYVVIMGDSGHRQRYGPPLSAAGHHRSWCRVRHGN